MRTVRPPTVAEFDSLDWEGGLDLGFPVPRFDFVTAEELESERRRDELRGDQKANPS